MRFQLVVLAVLVSSLQAQVSYDRLLHADREPQNWLSYSTLTQINRTNVKNLQLKWVDHPTTTAEAKMEVTPLVVDGVFYAGIRTEWWRSMRSRVGSTAVLAVDQDSIAAKRVVNTGGQQVFAKTESNGEAIVGLFNTGENAETVSIQVLESERGYSTRDLWTGERKKTRGDISAVVPAHGVVLCRVEAP